jgi:hypothetical protein
MKRWMETSSWRQEVGDRKLETGSWRQEVGDRELLLQKVVHKGFGFDDDTLEMLFQDSRLIGGEGAGVFGDRDVVSENDPSVTGREGLGIGVVCTAIDTATVEDDLLQ